MFTQGAVVKGGDFPARKLFRIDSGATPQKQRTTRKIGSVTKQQQQKLEVGGELAGAALEMKMPSPISDPPRIEMPTFIRSSTHPPS
jgi:hypothetical protein